MEAAAGSQTGVFAASMSDDYVRLIAKDPDEHPTTSAIGLSSAILANRISWFYDLKGPSLQVNTACSTGMIAMDVASQSLRTGQCSMVNPLAIYIQVFRFNVCTDNLIGTGCWMQYTAWP
jgi:acyl transferase domain-containing protein